MIGIEHLQALRKRGYVPKTGVIVWCSERPSKRSTIKTPWFDVTDAAEVIVGSDEHPLRLDLRPLHGLCVVVSGVDPARRQQIASAAFREGAYGAITDENGEYVGSIEEAAIG